MDGSVWIPTSFPSEADVQLELRKRWWDRIFSQTNSRLNMITSWGRKHIRSTA